MSAHVDTGALVDGLDAARQRLLGAAPADVASFFALFEVLAWAGAVRDRYSKEGREIPLELDGLYYARNVVLHQGADVLLWILVPGTVVTNTPGSRIIQPPGYIDWSWPAREQMPEPRSTAGAVAYDKRIVARSVPDVLDALMSALRPQTGAQGAGGESG